MRGKLVQAWYNALLYRQDPKKLPKRAEQLWSETPDQTVKQMIALAKAWASNTAEVLGPPKKKQKI